MLTPVVLTVVEMIQNLIQCGLAEEKDIGVITPFYKQIQKIRLLCNEKKLGYAFESNDAGLTFILIT